MTIVLYKFKCGGCGTSFDAPVAEGYAEFTLRSEGADTPAFLDALEDPVYREADMMLSDLGVYRGKAEVERVELLQNAFAATCDRDSDGSEFRIGLLPKCPCCGRRIATSWESTGEVFTGVIGRVTHTAWSSATAGERRKCLNRRI